MTDLEAVEKYAARGFPIAQCAKREIDKLRAALRAILELSWSPDGAPGPSCYLVAPVNAARAALVRAGELLDGESPFPADKNGSVMTIEHGDGNIWRAVWLAGRAYDAASRELVPEEFLEIFDKALRDV